MADYRDMWKNLDMDLETHDKLCAALPGLFGGAFLEQKDRPGAMDYFNMVIAEVHGLRIQELQEHKAQGGKVVGSFCIYVPEEIILALGGISVGLCAGSEFWVPAGEVVLPRNLCALIKAGVGAKLSRTCPYFQSVDLLVGENTCDGKKKAWEILGEHVSMHVMDLPNTKSPAGFALWRHEVNSLVEKLEHLTGNKLTLENLLQGVQVVEAKRAAIARLYEARKATPSPLSGLDAQLVSQVAFYDNPVRFTNSVNALAEECEKRIAAGKGVAPAQAPRVLVTGTPIVVPNWKIHSILETSGASVVVEENCTGTRYFEERVQTEGVHDLSGLLDAIARRYFDHINCACFSPNEKRMDDVVRLAKAYGVQGVVNQNLSFCTPYMVEGEKLRQRLTAEGIPLLSLETDYSSGDEGQLRTRVEAFLEVLR